MFHAKKMFPETKWKDSMFWKEELDHVKKKKKIKIMIKAYALEKTYFHERRSLS